MISIAGSAAAGDAYNKLYFHHQNISLLSILVLRYIAHRRNDIDQPIEETRFMESTAKLKFLRLGGRVIASGTENNREVWVLRKPATGLVVRTRAWATSLTFIHQLKLRRAFRCAFGQAIRPRAAASQMTLKAA